ncbi:DUF6455 family protein [Ruegeria sp. Ofav3-42]|uniref:DUF6455 family protein n=1 Tax=Ruegeria sp. Ofav3-42 TaxID=2917759 RepID=UPI001EF3E59B|nr:DUF6455 family protein [Ruegeria sp. Ofav3-42]MCG7519360.1 DUF6455 family protein [Ruegeria sp. Ofav3-42]
MPGKDTLKRHAELVDNMATRVGVDLEDAAISGKVTIDEISEAVIRCSACSNPDHCEGLLAEPDHDGKTPEYCKNKELLDRLTSASDSECND